MISHTATLCVKKWTHNLHLLESTPAFSNLRDIPLTPLPNFKTMYKGKYHFENNQGKHELGAVHGHTFRLNTFCNKLNGRKSLLPDSEIAACYQYLLLCKIAHPVPLQMVV